MLFFYTMQVIEAVSSFTPLKILFVNFPSVLESALYHLPSSFILVSLPGFVLEGFLKHLAILF